MNEIIHFVQDDAGGVQDDEGGVQADQVEVEDVKENDDGTVTG